ncbi:hypothetical protein [Spirosoma rigui]|uniref:hypothetical protein n=1 Tax=Spirosoma rigui TaxID=564064 RepID=UPI0009AFEB9C|nr:hypothetical protein [Spirosoma rigui]
MRYPPTLALVVPLFLACLGCQPGTSAPDAPGYDYFPLETGRFIVYDVTERQYSLVTPVVQRTYQLKEVTGPAYTDVTGSPAFRLLRYRRPAENQPWQADSVWSVRRVGDEAIRTENGVNFVTLHFPVSDLLRWNGNRYNSIGEDSYETRNSGQPYRVSDTQFDKTVTVIAQQDSTLVSQDKRIEVYARSVGMVYKERVQLQYCSSSPACIGSYQIDYGIRQVYRIRSYGNE